MKSLIFVATVAVIEFGVIAWADTAFKDSQAAAAECVCVFLPMLGVFQDIVKFNTCTHV